MVSFRLCCRFTLCLLLAGGLSAQAAVVQLTFDGTTTGGWTTTTVAPLGDPTTDPIAISAADSSNPTGANGIYYDDSSDGLQHYVAPESILNMDFTGMQLQFGFYIPQISGLDPVSPSEDDQITIADGGGGVVLIDNLIDVTAVDTL